MKQDKLQTMRHSASHILATAVLEMFPEAKLGTGPAIDNGFYYDFLLPRPLIPEDLPILQEKMEKIKKVKIPFEHYSKSIIDGTDFFEEIKQPFKVELIRDLKEKGEKEVSFYENKGENDNKFTDLCAGPHVENTGQIGTFKLTHFSGSYWKANAENQSMTRIYGLCFNTPKELRSYEKMIEEAKKRDHREIGKKMDLFSFHDEGQGFPFWHNNGMIIRNELIDFWREEHRREGYEEIATPMILNEQLWHQSGHWNNYKENMYFTEIDEQTYAVKPMNCPGGMLVYKEKQHSYRELPLKVGELGLVHRHELSGTLHGLFRVRNFTQDDAHVFCMKEQVEEEIMKVIKLEEKFYKMFGFKFHVELSTRPEKRTGSEEIWDLAENILEKVIKDSKLEYKINEGDGAFYGPKLDFHLKDCIGRTWQCGTIQLDFAMPERFELEYIGEDGKKHRPVMLHRVIFGSIERFIGILIENTEGFLPLWLAPKQVVILPVADTHEDYANEILAKLKANNIRTEIIGHENSLNKRIRKAEIERASLILVVGDKEKDEQAVTIRRPKHKKQENMSVDDFVERVGEVVRERGEW